MTHPFLRDGVGGNMALRSVVAHPVPNPYEAPSCQETNYPCERFFSFFPAFGFLALSADGVVS